MASRLLARSRQARSVAAHILQYGTQTDEPPEGVSRDSYVRALGRLAKAGVLRKWEWVIDGRPYCPQSVTAGWLWLPGARWHDFEQQASEAGLVFDRTPWGAA